MIDKRQQEFQSAQGDDALCDDGISMQITNNILSVPSFVSIFYSEKRRPFLDLLLEGSANGTALSKKDLSDEVNTFMFEVRPTSNKFLWWD